MDLFLECKLRGLRKPTILELYYMKKANEKIIKAINNKGFSEFMGVSLEPDEEDSGFGGVGIY
jgi:hypothetical protein